MKTKPKTKPAAKKTVSRLLALLLALITVFSTVATVSAAHSDDEFTDAKTGMTVRRLYTTKAKNASGNYFSLFYGCNPYTDSGNWPIVGGTKFADEMSAAGKDSHDYGTKGGAQWFYCIHYGPLAYSEHTTTDQTIATANAYWNGLSDAQRRGVMLALSCGFPNVADVYFNAEGYAATQLIIWEFTNGGRTTPFQTSGWGTSTAIRSYNGSKFKDAYDAILKTMATRCLTPTFVDSSSNKNVTNISTDTTTVTLKGTGYENGVLLKTGSSKPYYRFGTGASDYSSYSENLAINMNNWTVSKNGLNVEVRDTNNLYVWADAGYEGKTVSATLKRNISGNGGWVTLAGSQELVTGVPKVDISFKLQAKVPLVPGTATLKKTSASGEIEGYKFTISNNHDGKWDTVYGISASNGNIYRAVPSNTNDPAHSSWTAVTENGSYVYTFKDLVDGTYYFREWCGESDSFPTQVTVKVVDKNNNVKTTVFQGSDLKEDTADSNQGHKGDCTFGPLEIKGLTGGGRMEITINNEKNTSTMSMVKQSDSGDVAGYIFAVKNNSTGVTIYGKSDSSGNIYKINKNGNSYTTTGTYTFEGMSSGSYTFTEYIPDGKKVNLESWAVEVYVNGITADYNKLSASSFASNGTVTLNGTKYTAYTLKTPCQIRYLETDGARLKLTIKNAKQPEYGWAELYKVASYASDAPGTPLSGAEFEIRDSSGAVIPNAISEVSTGYYKTIALPVGDYTIRETKAPKVGDTQYRIDSRTYAFTIVANDTQRISNTTYDGTRFGNDQLYSSRLLKTVAGEKGSVEGFKFILYKGKQYYLKTDDTGLAYITDSSFNGNNGTELELKHYQDDCGYLIEKATPGYSMSEITITLMMDNEETRRPVFVGVYAAGETDGDCEQFKVTSSTTYNGIQLQPGDYLIEFDKFTRSTDGKSLEQFWTDLGYELGWSPKVNTDYYLVIEIENAPDDSKTTIKKTMSDGSTGNLEGYCFELTDMSDRDHPIYGRTDSEGNVYQTDANYTKKTNPGQSAYTITGLDDGYYSFVEQPHPDHPSAYPSSIEFWVTPAGGTRKLVKAFTAAQCAAARQPNGSCVLTGINITGLTAGGKLEIVVENSESATTITKLVSDGSQNKDGWRFRLANTATGKAVYGQSNKDGKVYQTNASFTKLTPESFIFRDLTDGTYTFLEYGSSKYPAYRPTSVKIYVTKAGSTTRTLVKEFNQAACEAARRYKNGGYYWSFSGIKLTGLTGGGKLEIEITNTPYGTFWVHKVDEDDKYDLSDAEFDIYDLNGNLVGSMGPTDATGYAESPVLPYGTYRVVETAWPEHHPQKPGVSYQWMVVVNADSGKKDNAKELTNKIGIGLITVKKLDEKYQPLAKVYFTIRNADDPTKVYTLGPTDANGDAEVTVPYGNYVVVESQTVPGYEISLTEYKGTVSEDTNWEFSFTAVNYPKTGYIEVYKKTQDGKDLAGAVFAVYNEDGNFLTQTGETDDSGYARTSDEDGLYYNQTYTVKEIQFPDNYQPAGNQVTAIDTPAWNVMVYNFKLVLTGGKANAVYTVSRNGTEITTVTADEYGKATTDALDSGTYTVTQDGSAGSYTVTVAPAPTWTVPLNEDTAPNGFYHIDAVNALEQAQIEVLKTTPDGKKLSGAEFTIYDNNDGTIADKITTDSKGYGISKPLDMGTYRVVETKFPANCTSSGTTEWNVTLSGTTTTERIYHIDAVNIPYGSVKVIKEAEDHFKSGFKFRLYGGEIDITKTTDETGTVVFEKIPIGTYTISEVDTDIRYVVPSDQNKTVKWGEETTATFENELKKFRVVLTKTDVETSVAQGDATLKGAVYGIYKNGKLVDTYETDANGGFTTEYYDCGTDWTVKEIKPSEGYLLDPTVYPVGAEAKLFTLERNDVPVNATEQVIKGQIKLIKTYENGREPEVKPELNATFEVYLKSAGSYKKAKETERDLLICDADGVATSKKLPYGTYVVHQITGDVSALLVADFEVKVFENEKLYSYEQHDNAVFGTVSIVKKDAETGEVIPYKGVFIQILDLTTNQLVTYFDETTNKTIDTFETDEYGVCWTPELPYGAYRVTEVRAPKGYLLNDKPVDFTVTRDHATAEVILYDKPAKGSITVEKVGEMFATVTEKDGIYQPVYELQGLEGATFEIRAAEDISTLDGTKHHSKGDLVATITTGRDGKATATDLYLGSYTITEIAAPDEMVLNTQPQTVTLTYNEETATANVLDDVVIENDRQKVSITLHKEMEEDERFVIGMNGEVENVSFGIYAAEEITAADETVIPKDGLLEVVYCNADGDAVFTTDLPINAAYYVKEVSTDDHYQVTDATYPVYFEYQGQEVAVVEIELEEVINTLIRGDISGRKLDEDGAPLAGALFGLFRDDESVFTEETAFLTVESDENGEFSFTDVPYGSYVVRELRTADERYALNTELYPAVVDGSEEEPIEIEIVNHLIRGTAMTIKVDAEYPENRLTGATFEIYSDVDGNKEFDAEIDTLIGEMTETETGVYTRTELLYGGYFLYEKEAPKNFVKDDGYYYFEITQDGETVEVENEAGVGFLNHPVKVPFEITKTDVADGKPLPNAGFRIKDEEGNVVVEGRTDENGIATFELRVGKYTYEEFDAPKGYLIDTTPHAFEIKANDEIVKAAMTNEKAPITGDSGNIQVWLTLCFSSMAALLVLFVLRRKLREEQK